MPVCPLPGSLRHLPGEAPRRGCRRAAGIETYRARGADFPRMVPEPRVAARPRRSGSRDQRPVSRPASRPRFMASPEAPTWRSLRNALATRTFRQRSGISTCSLTLTTPRSTPSARSATAPRGSQPESAGMAPERPSSGPAGARSEGSAPRQPVQTSPDVDPGHCRIEP